jgi:hypothetical protein
MSDKVFNMHLSVFIGSLFQCYYSYFKLSIIVGDLGKKVLFKLTTLSQK